jgi:hypothetical protein
MPSWRWCRRCFIRLLHCVLHRMSVLLRVQVLAGCADGRSHLHDSPARVTAALVELMGHPGSSWAAATDAAVCIAGGRQVHESSDGAVCAG